MSFEGLLVSKNFEIKTQYYYFHRPLGIKKVQPTSYIYGIFQSIDFRNAHGFTSWSNYQTNFLRNSKLASKYAATNWSTNTNALSTASEHDQLMEPQVDIKEDQTQELDDAIDMHADESLGNYPMLEPEVDINEDVDDDDKTNQFPQKIEPVDDIKKDYNSQTEIKQDESTTNEPDGDSNVRKTEQDNNVFTDNQTIEMSTLKEDLDSRNLLEINRSTANPDHNKADPDHTSEEGQIELQNNVVPSNDKVNQRHTNDEQKVDQVNELFVHLCQSHVGKQGSQSSNKLSEQNQDQKQQELLQKQLKLLSHLHQQISSSQQQFGQQYKPELLQKHQQKLLQQQLQYQRLSQHEYLKEFQNNKKFEQQKQAQQQQQEYH